MLASALLFIFTFVLFGKLKPSCFPELNEELCFSCSSDCFSPGMLYSNQNELIKRSSCIKRNSSYVPIRRLLVGFPSQHSICLNSSNQNYSLLCAEFNQFLKGFDAFYDNIYDAFLTENAILNAYSNSTVYFYIFGEARAYASSETSLRIEFFRRVFVQIFILPLECTDALAQAQICSFYSKTTPVLLIKKINPPSIFVTSALTISRVCFRYINSTNDANLKNGLFFIKLEPNLDSLPYKNAELNIQNSKLEDTTGVQNGLVFIALSKLAGSVLLSLLEVRNLLSANLLMVEDLLEPIYYNEESKNYLKSMQNESTIKMSNVSFWNVNIVTTSVSFISVERFYGAIIFEGVYISQFVTSHDFISLDNCNFKNVIITNIIILNSSFNTMLVAIRTGISVSGFNLTGIIFSTSPLITISESPSTELSKIEMTNINNLNSLIRAPVLSIFKCKAFALISSIFYLSDGFEIEVILSFSIFEKVSFIKLKYYDFIFNAISSNLTISNCVLTEIDGPGVIFKQFREDLIILNSKLSYIQGIVVINFDELRNNIIANCEMTLINGPQYFWARNLQVINQTLVNNTFSESSFLRIQSFYRAFSFYPLVVYKNCLFINIQFSYYGFDYCCLDLFIINVTYKNIEMIKGTSRLYAIEQNGNFAYINSTFIDVGWFVYEKSSSGAYNQALLALWYPSSFLLSNCSFLQSKNISLRSGFITCQDLNRPILIENSTFIVRNPSIQLPVKGMILLAITKVEIKHCLFINLTGDMLSLAYSHVNGVISLLGSLSLLEKRSNNNEAIFINVTISNVIAKNGAGLSVVSYNNLSLSNCSFTNGTAINGLGGLLALVFVKNLFVQFTNFTNGTAYSGGLVYLKDIGSGVFFESNFMISESFESGGCFSIEASKTSIISASMIGCKTNGTGGALFQQKGALFLNAVRFKNITAFSDGGVFSMEDVEALGATNTNFDGVEAGGKGGLLFGELRITRFQGLYCQSVESKDDGTILNQENYLEIFICDAWFANLNCKDLCGDGLIVAKTLVQQSFIEIKATDFTRCYSNQGSVILVNSDTSILLKDIDIGDWKGGTILSLSGVSSIDITIRNISVKNSISNEPNLFDFKYSISVYISDLILERNIFESELINILQCYSYFERFSFIFNTKLALTPVSSSYFYIVNCFFTLNGFLTETQAPSQSLSDISLGSDSSFYIFLAEDSILYLEAIPASLGESPFLQGFNIDLTLSGVNITNRSKNKYLPIIMVSTGEVCKVIIEYCNFTFLQGMCFQIIQPGSVQLKDSFFSGLGNEKYNRNAIYMEQINRIVILNSMFENLFSHMGAAVAMGSLRGSTVIEISNTKFIACESSLGGALFFSNYFDVKIINCSFVRNVAAVPNKESEKGRGGAAYLACPGEKLNQTCKGEINSSYFENNYADEFGSTIYTNILLQAQNDNEFKNNKDGFNFSSGFSGYPLKVKKDLNSKVDELKFDLKSGQPENLTLYLTDFFGNVFNFDDQSSAKLLPKDTKPAINLLNDFCIAKNGAFNFPNFIIKGPSDFNVSLILEIQFQHDPIRAQLKLSFELEVYIKPCLLGEIIQLDYSCKKCERGTFSFSDPRKITDCKKCLDDFECLGGDEVYPAQGYWRSNRYEIKSVKCINENACLGSSKENKTDLDVIHGACANGHFGVLCFECVKGFGKFEKGGLCEPCNKDRPFFIVRVVLISVFIIFYMALNAYVFSLDLGTRGNSSDFIDLKILFSHFQTISITTFMEDISSLPSMKELVEFQGYMSFINDDIISIDCIFQDFLKKEYTNMYKVIFTVALPFAVGTIALLFWIFFTFIYTLYVNMERIRKITSGSGGRISALRHEQVGKKIFLKRIVISFAVGAYLLYPMILQSAFSLPNCIEIPDEVAGLKEHLYVSPNVKCWENEHLQFIYFLFFPSIFLWALAFPVSLFYLLKMSKSPKKQAMINDIKRQISLRSTKRKRSKLLTLVEDKIFRFFYEDYKEKFYYWEIVIFSKKFILIALSSIRNLIGRDTKFILIILSLLVYGVIVINKRPFRSEICNLFEIVSALICIFTVLLLTILHYEQRMDIVMGLGMITVLMNGIFIFFLILNIGRKVIKTLAEKKKKFFESKIMKGITARMKISKQESTNSRLDSSESAHGSNKNIIVEVDHKPSHFLKSDFNKKNNYVGE